MDAARKIRIGAVCAFLYVVIFIGSQAYLSYAAGHLGKDALPTTIKGTVDEQTRIYLVFAHRHADLFVSGALLAVLSYLVLPGLAFGLFQMLRLQRPTASRIALYVGAASVLVLVAELVAEAVTWTTFPSQYNSAVGAKAQLLVIHNFENQFNIYQILDILGNIGLAAWLGLLGVILLRIKGTSNMLGWGTIGACVLLGIRVPILVAWSAGAGIGLWRMSRAWALAGDPAPAPPWAGDSGPAPATTTDDGPRAGSRPARPAHARGAGRRRRRRH